MFYEQCALIITKLGTCTAVATRNYVNYHSVLISGHLVKMNFSSLAKNYAHW